MSVIFTVLTMPYVADCESCKSYIKRPAYAAIRTNRKDVFSNSLDFQMHWLSNVLKKLCPE